jgi:hypothetical protein
MRTCSNTPIFRRLWATRAPDLVCYEHARDTGSSVPLRNIAAGELPSFSTCSVPVDSCPDDDCTFEAHDTGPHSHNVFGV